MKKSDLTRIMNALGLRIASENAKSHYLNCSCPFAPFGLHKNSSDHSASFGCRYDDRGISSFKCYACKQKGSVRNLARRLGSLRRVDYSAIIAEIQALEGGAISTIGFEPFDKEHDFSPIIEPLNEAIYDGLYPAAWDVPEARDYLIDRGISPETAENLGLLYRDIYMIERQDGSVGEWFRGDILFPVRNRDGQLFGWSGRTTRDAFGVKPKVYDKDLPKRHLILGEERWIEGRPTIIVEGLFGYAWLIEIGVEEFANVGALMGSVLTPEKAAILKAWGNPVVALLDNDQAGDVGLFGALNEDGVRDGDQALVPQLIGSLLVTVPEWPYLPQPVQRNDGSWKEQKEDPDELVLDEVRAMVFETTPMAPPKRKDQRPRFYVDKHSNRR